ncbi:HTH_XRE domain containing protein [uncultured Caudovirales phage]|uniref:HTH_XRE domain containing protein n=1 Tax=uncultured Caudovirales phage TaxID=2100421 RepID=A0A6J7WTS9_9CAUD|nr:HTH_XRE domain containing protein [uncultured Caudovirales phage]
MTSDLSREKFTKWLKDNDLNVHSAARKAGVSPGAIYNFLAGTSESLSSNVLQKLAKATGNSVDAILTGSASRAIIPVTYRIGGSGRVFQIDEGENISVKRPAGIAEGDGIAAAIIDGDSLLPIPAGWVVFFQTATEAPETLIGKMAVVRFSGGGDKPIVRTIRRGTKAGLFTLHAFNGAILEDVEIVAAHLVVSFSQGDT